MQLGILSSLAGPARQLGVDTFMLECWNTPYEAGFYCKRLVKKSAKGSNKKIMFGGCLLNVSKCCLPLKGTVPLVWPKTATKPPN